MLSENLQEGTEYAVALLLFLYEYITHLSFFVVSSYKTQKKLKALGVPTYIGSGQIQGQKEKLRFMIMERFGTDLQKLFEQNNKKFKRKTVCCLALQIVSLEASVTEQHYDCLIVI